MIDILLATYNGEPYLTQQIDSLLSQTFQEWRLIIRDDRSWDRTRDICKKYADKYPNKINILEDGLGSLGVIKNFETLLRSSTSEHIMFCDQDDVWLPDKILATYEQMVEAETLFSIETSIMVYTDLKVVDSQLNPISDSIFKYQNRDPYIDGKISKLIMASCTAGCTIMINKKLKNLCKGFPPGTIMYDWWLAMIAVTFGKLIFLDTPTIIYRRHESNTTNLQKSGLIRHFKGGNLLSRNRRDLNGIFKQHELFYNMFHEMMNSSQRKMFEDISSIPYRNWIMRRYLIMKHRLFKTGLVRNIGLFITV